MTAAGKLECVIDGGTAVVTCVLGALRAIYPKTWPQWQLRPGNCHDRAVTRSARRDWMHQNLHAATTHQQATGSSLFSATCSLAVPTLPPHHSLQTPFIQVLHFKI